MKKSDNLVDKALDVARKARSVPKRPVKTKGKKTVPEALDWGPGIPLDKLAYLNDDEMALVQAKRMFKGKRKYKGVPAFPDPGDTAAGDRGQGTSSSSGLGNNTSGGSTYGGGGGRDSGAGGAGGMGSYGGSTEGSREGGGSGTSGVGGGSTAAGAGVGAGTGDRGSGSSAAASSSGTTSTSAGSTSQSKSSGPSGGPTSQPARTETSSYAAPPSAPAAPTGYPSYGGYNPVTSAPSTMASEAALDRIASGSSVIGNTTPQGYAVPKDQARIAPVNYAQTPTTPVDTTGANSPFADQSVSQYDADNPSLAGAVSQYSQYRSPPAPTTAAFTNAQNAMYTAQDAANFGEDGALPRGGGPMTVQDPTPTGVAGSLPAQVNANETIVNKTATAPYNTMGPNVGLGYTPATPGSYVATKAAAPAGVQPPQDRIVSSSAYAQPNLSEAAQSYAFNTPGASWDSFRDYGAIRSTPQSMAAMNEAQPVMGAGTPTEISVDGAGVPVGTQVVTDPRVNIPPSSYVNTATGVVPAGVDTAPPAGEVTDEYAYDPAQDPADYMRPIYPGSENEPYYMTDSQRAAYLDSVSGTRSSERPAYVPEKKEEKTPVEKKKRKKPPRQKDDKYVYRDYIYDDYGNLGARPNQRIVDFNRYNQQNFNKGGKVGDSVQAALRIAKSKLL
jgi:hypothetical protein